ELRYQPGLPDHYPAFFRGSFHVDRPADTYLALPGWTKGVAWVNGFNLGRYWKRGPQKTLYIPAPLLEAGANEIVLFELHGASKPEVDLRAEADLG
nr:beta-galactosidase [Anaerolinea sp.]